MSSDVLLGLDKVVDVRQATLRALIGVGVMQVRKKSVLHLRAEAIGRGGRWR